MKNYFFFKFFQNEFIFLSNNILKSEMDFLFKTWPRYYI